MIVHGFVTRPTKDVDLFTEVDDHEARQVAAALRRALEEQDLVTHDAERPPLDHRFVAVDPTTGAECTVEVFPDGGRLHDRVTLDLGPVLHPDDLAADKMLALWGRARPRDFFDVAALIDRYGDERLLELAEAKDSGLPARHLLMPSVPSHDSVMPTGQKTGSAVTTPSGSAQTSMPGATNWSSTGHGEKLNFTSATT